MTQYIHRESDYSLATITKKLDTVTAFITIDVHSEKTVATQATQMMYPDALLSGTQKKTRSEFLHVANLLGGSIGVTINGGSLTISLRSTSDSFPKLLKLVDEMILTPAFPKAELKRIADTTINELRESKEDSSGIAQEELLNTLYGTGDRKYSYEVDETIEMVTATSARHLKALHHDMLTQAWTCSIAADKKLCALFEAFIKKAKKLYTLQTIVSIHQQKTPKPTAVFKNIPSRQNIDLSIGAPLPFTLHHPDYIPLSFGITVLGLRSFAGRLMSTVREKEGLTYDIYGQLEGFSGTEQGHWRIMTFFAPDKAEQGLISTFREITKMYKKGITEAELLKFKTILKTREALLGDSVSSQLSSLHNYNRHGFSLQEIEERKEKVTELTLQEVNKALKTYLDPATLTVSGAGPTKAVQKSLKDFVKNVS